MRLRLTVVMYYNDRYRVLTRGFREPMVVDAGDTGVLLILFLITLLGLRCFSLRPRRGKLLRRKGGLTREYNNAYSILATDVS